MLVKSVLSVLQFPQPLSFQYIKHVLTRPFLSGKQAQRGPNTRHSTACVRETLRRQGASSPPHSRGRSSRFWALSGLDAAGEILSHLVFKAHTIWLLNGLMFSTRIFSCRLLGLKADNWVAQISSFKEKFPSVAKAQGSIC